MILEVDNTSKQIIKALEDSIKSAINSGLGNNKEALDELKDKIEENLPESRFEEKTNALSEEIQQHLKEALDELKDKIEENLSESKFEEKTNALSEEIQHNLKEALDELKDKIEKNLSESKFEEETDALSMEIQKIQNEIKNSNAHEIISKIDSASEDFQKRLECIKEQTGNLLSEAEFKEEITRIFSNQNMYREKIKKDILGIQTEILQCQNEITSIAEQERQIIKLCNTNHKYLVSITEYMALPWYKKIFKRLENSFNEET